MIPKKTPELSRLVPAAMLIAALIAASGCGLKGNLYIPVDEPDAPPETEIETEIQTGTGIGPEVEVETEPTELETTEQSNPESN